MTERIEDLGAIEVLDEQGGTVVLGSVWAERPALLFFIRHFG